MQRADSLEKPLTLEKIEGKRSGVVESEMFRKHHGHGHEQIPGDIGGQSFSPRGSQRVRHDLVTEQQLQYHNLHNFFIFKRSIIFTKYCY